jgi:hypothetical protein
VIGEPKVARSYLHCTATPGMPLQWDDVAELDAGHWPMFTAPEALAAALSR